MRWDIIEEHLDEAAFLWGRRESSWSASDYALPEVAELEARLCAHVDALVLAGTPAAQRVLRNALLDEEAQRVAVAALALLGQGSSGLSMVLEHLRKGGPAQRLGVASALFACEDSGLVLQLLPCLGDDEPELRVLVLGLLGHWRTSPGPVLQQFLVSSEPQVQAAAFQLAAQVPAPIALETLKHGLASRVPGVRNAAIQTGLVLGYKEAWAACLAVVGARAPASQLPMLLVAMGGGVKEQELLLDALSIPALRRDALWALGFSGRVQAADACLTMMRNEDSLLARLAGEAFSSITGLELKNGYVARESPEEESLPPLEEEDLDANLTPVPEQALPLPSPDAVEQWWAHARGSFELKGRYLRGRPFSWRMLLEQLEHGPMRRRPVHALELLIRSRGEHRISLGAFAELQQRELSRAHRPEEVMCPSFERLPMRQWTPAPASVLGAHVATRVSSAQGRRSVSLGARALVVRGLGMVSPLGEDVVMSCAASRAGIPCIAALDALDVWDPDGERMQPAAGCYIPGLAEGFTGFGRLARLGAAGLKDLLGRTQVPDWRRTGLFLVLPDGQHLLDHEEALRRDAEIEGVEPESLPGELVSTLRRSCGQSLLLTLAKHVEPSLSQAHLRLFWQGRAGFALALEEANDALECGKLDRCIIGGIDSLVDRPVLEALKHLNRLKAPSQPVGVVPGECAAFVLVDKGRASATRDGNVLCIIDGLSFSRGEGERGASSVSEAGCALGQTLALTLGGGSAEGIQVALLSGCINGDERTAYTWGHALPWLRARGLLDAPFEWHPALSFGEIGAATGPAALCLVAHAFGRGVAPHGNGLVWLLDESGARGSFLLRPPGG